MVFGDCSFPICRKGIKDFLFFGLMRKLKIKKLKKMSRSLDGDARIGEAFLDLGKAL